MNDTGKVPPADTWEAVRWTVPQKFIVLSPHSQPQDRKEGPLLYGEPSGPCVRNRVGHVGQAGEVTEASRAPISMTTT